MKKTLKTGITIFFLFFLIISAHCQTVEQHTHDLTVSEYGDYRKVFSINGLTANTPLIVTYTFTQPGRFSVSNGTDFYKEIYGAESGSCRLISSITGKLDFEVVLLLDVANMLELNDLILSITCSVDNSCAVNQNMFINNDITIDGKLGVGTRYPSNKFEIVEGQGKFSFSAASCTTNACEVANTIDNNGYRINIPSNKYFKIGDRLKLLSSENIGIGTYALNSSSLTGAYNTGIGYNALKYNTTGGNNLALGYYAMYANTSGGYNIALGNNALYSNTIGINNIAVGQNAGRYIANGTTSNSNSSNSIFIGYGSKALADNQTNQVVIGYNAVGNGNNSITLGNTSVDNTIINGKIGIGITNPAAGLHVTKTYNNIAAILGNTINDWTCFGGVNGGKIRGSNEGYLVLESNPNGVDKNLYFNLNSPGNISMANGGGRVGIGTLTPNNSYKLDVNGEAGFSNNVNIGASQTNSYVKINTSSRSWWTGIGVNDGDNRFVIYDQTTGNHALTIGTDGNVGIGIGTSQATHKLEVKGTIHAIEVLVDLNAPLADYVFSPTYRLRPLHEVEQFVKTNNHLPEIPSATEVKDKGMNMGEMQNKLLQKVEELMLYVIEQQKMINQQSAEINQQNEKIKELEGKLR